MVRTLISGKTVSGTPNSLSLEDKGGLKAAGQDVLEVAADLGLELKGELATVVGLKEDEDVFN